MRLLKTRASGLKLALFSIMHLVVDGLCSYLIFTKLYSDSPIESVLVFFIYNILAFVTQSPFGMLIDKYNKPKAFLGVSILTMIIGYLFSGIWFVAVTMIGISNALFHVAGGKYVTDYSGNNISHLGIFVSTGAIGLVLGQRYFSFKAMPYVFFITLILCGLLVILLDDGEIKGYDEIYCEKANWTYALLAIVGIVVIRSFVGRVASPDFTMEGHIFLVVALATALGKALGGVFSKLFGVQTTTYVSMSVAALCLTVGAFSPILFIIGIFAFNFTMPITLYYANVLLKGSEGFAFGTLAASLVPGYFIAMSLSYSFPMRILTVILCIVSMLVIVFVSKRVRNYAEGINTDDCN